MFKGSKILVAGGAGFIGVNLINRLVSLDAEVRATLHKRPAVIQHDNVHYVQADLTKMEDCKRVVDGIDYAFMCAANTSGAAVIAEKPLAHITPNVVMNTQMLEAAYQAKVKKFLFISSSVVYPPAGDRPTREEEVFDGEPHEVYYSAGWMKRYAEILCRVYSQKIKNPMPVVVVRPSNAYGPYDKFDYKTSHMTAALIRRVIERQNPIEVWGTGDDIRDLIYIDDLISGMLLAFEKSNGYLGVNIASGQGYSVKGILKTILEVDDYLDAKVRFDPSKPKTIPLRLIDTTLAKRKIGFHPSTNLSEGLYRTIQWYREHRFIWKK